jgi:hypothetical protein
MTTPENLADMAYRDVPAPPGATVGAWEHHPEHGWSRLAVWASYDGATDPRLGGILASVDVTGWQHCDGSFTRHAALWGVVEGQELTGAQARAVAALLNLAADECDPGGNNFPPESDRKPSPTPSE